MSLPDTSTKGKGLNMSETKIFNLQDKRSEAVERKRRNFERVLFDDFLGCYGVIDEHGSTYPIKLVDISKDGCQFQVPANPRNETKFKTGNDITLRIYFSKNSFLPVSVKLRHGSEYIDDRGDAHMRYGAEFDKSLVSYRALEKFIEFIYMYADASCNDREQNKVYFL